MHTVAPRAQACLEAGDVQLRVALDTYSAGVLKAYAGVKQSILGILAAPLDDVGDAAHVKRVTFNLNAASCGSNDGPAAGPHWQLGVLGAVHDRLIDRLQAYADDRSLDAASIEQVEVLQQDARAVAAAIEGIRRKLPSDATAGPTPSATTPRPPPWHARELPVPASIGEPDSLRVSQSKLGPAAGNVATEPSLPTVSTGGGQPHPASASPAHGDDSGASFSTAEAADSSRGGVSVVGSTPRGPDVGASPAPARELRAMFDAAATSSVTTLDRGLAGAGLSSPATAPQNRSHDVAAGPVSPLQGVTALPTVAQTPLAAVGEMMSTSVVATPLTRERSQQLIATAVRLATRPRIAPSSAGTASDAAASTGVYDASVSLASAASFDGGRDASSHRSWDLLARAGCADAEGLLAQVDAMLMLGNEPPQASSCNTSAAGSSGPTLLQAPPPASPVAATHAVAQRQIALEPVEEPPQTELDRSFDRAQAATRALRQLAAALDEAVQQPSVANASLSRDTRLRLPRAPEAQLSPGGIVPLQDPRTPSHHEPRQQQQPLQTADDDDAEQLALGAVSPVSSVGGGEEEGGERGDGWLWRMPLTSQHTTSSQRMLPLSPRQSVSAPTMTSPVSSAGGEGQVVDFSISTDSSASCSVSSPAVAVAPGRSTAVPLTPAVAGPPICPSPAVPTGPDESSASAAPSSTIARRLFPDAVGCAAAAANTRYETAEFSPAGRSAAGASTSEENAVATPDSDRIRLPSLSRSFKSHARGPAAAPAPLARADGSAVARVLQLARQSPPPSVGAALLRPHISSPPPPPVQHAAQSSPAQQASRIPRLLGPSAHTSPPQYRFPAQGTAAATPLPADEAAGRPYDPRAYTSAPTPPRSRPSTVPAPQPAAVAASHSAIGVVFDAQAALSPIVAAVSPAPGGGSATPASATRRLARAVETPETVIRGSGGGSAGKPPLVRPSPQRAAQLEQLARAAAARAMRQVRRGGGGRGSGSKRLSAGSALEPALSALGPRPAASLTAVAAALANGGIVVGRQVPAAPIGWKSPVHAPPALAASAAARAPALGRQILAPLAPPNDGAARTPTAAARGEDEPRSGRAGLLDPLPASYLARAGSPRPSTSITTAPSAPAEAEVAVRSSGIASALRRRRTVGVLLSP